MSDTYDFGHTNDKSLWDAANAFREAAIADGWLANPTYSHEPIEQHATLNRGDFTMMVNARTNQGNWKYIAKVDIWGPDKRAIVVPNIYDWTKIQSALRTCMECKASDVETFRFSFAGRCCAKCLPAMQRRSEYPGWCD